MFTFSPAHLLLLADVPVPLLSPINSSHTDVVVIVAAWCCCWCQDSRVQRDWVPKWNRLWVIKRNIRWICEPCVCELTVCMPLSLFTMGNQKSKFASRIPNITPSLPIFVPYMNMNTRMCARYEWNVPSKSIENHQKFTIIENWVVLERGVGISHEHEEMKSNFQESSQFTWKLHPNGVCVARYISIPASTACSRAQVGRNVMMLMMRIYFNWKKREKKASKSQARDSESLFELFTWVANDFNSQFTLEGELKCLMKWRREKNPEVASRRSRTKSWLGNLARLIFRGNLALARLAHRRKEL